MLNTFLNSINQGLFPVVIKLLVILLPIFLPIILIIVFWILRFRWLTLKFVEAQKPCLLEIKLPKEILKSPAGMEIFFSYLWQSGAGNWGEAFIDGKTRPWFSCELVSTGGQVRFFIWCSQDKFKNLVEAQLYAQYPNLEIYAVDQSADYTNAVSFNMEKYNMAATQYKFAKSDPYPIKTYIDYGLDQNPKDEHKIDPITSVLEFLGSLKAGENAWIQILIEKHESESWKHGVLALESDEKKDGFFKKLMIPIFGKARKIKDEHKEEIEKIRKEAIPESKGDYEMPRFPNPTKGQNERIAALERSMGKTAFDCMIRSVYIAKKDAFNSANIGGLIGCLRQYGSGDLNSFRPISADISDERKDLTRILPFLKKSNDERISLYKKNLLHAYKLRSFFQWPYKHYKAKPFIMNTEELATMFHFPGGIVSQTPTLKRVESKKSEAPSNLPI